MAICKFKILTALFEFVFQSLLPEVMSKGRSESFKFSSSLKSVLSSDEMELYELAQLAGVAMDPKVLKY